MVLGVLGQTTEAGIRQELRADALAVIFDEAEEDGEAARRRIQAVLALARQASSESGARTLKGTVHGGALQFRIRSMFCMASIGGAVPSGSMTKSARKRAISSGVLPEMPNAERL